MKLYFLFPLVTLFFILSSCHRQPILFAYPPVARIQSEKQMLRGHNTPVYIGGYGSSMSYHTEDSTFWLLTDRGPNVDGPTPESKVFVLPDYTPHIGVFRLQGDSLLLIRKIFLRDSTGQLFCGLPNVEGDGMTGETAYDGEGKVIRTSGRRGLDPEGLALAPDGTFWVSDEYGPYLLHFDAQGQLIEEFSPFNGKLPVYYAYRRPNRGMEGLTIHPSGHLLYGIMQSPLNLPDGSRPGYPAFLRLLAFCPSDHTFREFAYQTEKPENVVSEMTFLDDTTFLVLERDGNFPDKGKGFKRIFRINIARATDLAPCPSLPEQATERPDSIRLVEKQLFCDILQIHPDYPHDKPEGMALINGNVLCLVNDDDFGINAPGKPDGRFIAKVRPDKIPDRGEMYFIRLH